MQERAHEASDPGGFLTGRGRGRDPRPLRNKPVGGPRAARPWIPDPRCPDPRPPPSWRRPALQPLPRALRTPLSSPAGGWRRRPGKTRSRRCTTRCGATSRTARASGRCAAALRRENDTNTAGSPPLSPRHGRTRLERLADWSARTLGELQGSAVSESWTGSCSQDQWDHMWATMVKAHVTERPPPISAWAVVGA